MTLDVRWIIESDVLSYTDNLIEYLRAKNIYYKETNYQEVLYYNYKDKFGGLVDSEVATNGVAVVEINSFSCANLYKMNMNKVVPTINELATDIYKENNED